MLRVNLSNNFAYQGSQQGMLQPWRSHSLYDILQIDAISIEELDLLSVLVTDNTGESQTHLRFLDTKSQCRFQYRHANG